MPIRTAIRINRYIGRYLPEQRLFLRSDYGTRYVRLRPASQAILLTALGIFFVWSIVATAMVVIDATGSVSLRAQNQRMQTNYETRLNQLSDERDMRAVEAQKAQERFYVALGQISEMQGALLASEDRRKELETGIEVVQRTLRTVMKERDRAREQSDALLSELQSVTGSVQTVAGKTRDIEETLDYLTAALEATATQRDTAADARRESDEKIAELKHQAALVAERNERIFTRLEEAVTVSMAPLERMFEQAGVPTDKLIEDVRRGYSGEGGPLTPLSVSTRNPEADVDSLRANALIAELDKVNLHRLAAFSLPFGLPVQRAYRMSSGYGARRHPVTGRYSKHEGMDMAAPRGTPVYATADGVVTFSGWSGAYGKMVKIQHAMGYETRYAHNSVLRVKVGQRVSRGDRIADMGSTGRSTGNHVHYEVRIGGKSVNPLKYIKAARNVF